MVGVILDNVSDKDNDSDNDLIPAFTLVNESVNEIVSANALNFDAPAVIESDNDDDSDNCLCIPCVLANKSVITTSPPLVVSNNALSNIASSYIVLRSVICTVWFFLVSNNTESKIT